MNKVFGLLLVLSAGVVFGCGSVSKEILSKSSDERTDVFHEVSNDGNVSLNMAALVIKAQIKTHPEGFYVLESKDNPHGKPVYPILINVDGQHIVWQMEGTKETTSFYDKDGKNTIDGGPGMRYILEKRIEIAPGSHKVFIALPGDNYYKEFEVVLEKDTVRNLELTPIYLKDSRRRSTYLRGIKDFEIVLR